MTTKRR